ncbi:bifunctional (p)ppGpp synthetase/guanosine-3',5'-bis(diphosphate) 3'-pyrophosphohydrolase [Streptomyces tateyamensis]|uniref:Bifunctional (P)ppGpp synthetase/guanosine-3',5'-bis(Diphosphate) 3'-pyrophosphohydrolase n=1 Tax=Streptomyces tateyamensis TaxID=565073 RepID=A0A2V4NMM9_9ACTN|nr:HD domain-containing protein [Streptomyces tateyamensis]PYC76946.1 bifunctional (p)ppGpp synthetase/guanosine-3',5'-bis(diphosphate) 3'-pyrophosphohydrolase [Streptomyces tateyamensis]
MTVETGRPPGQRPDQPASESPGRRLLGRAALGRAGRAALLATGRPPVPDAIEPIVQVHRRHHPQADLALLGRAYRLAEASHRGQKRKSGEPYITHPLAVTLILAQLGAETTTLVAALLHDTVEDTEVTLDQVAADFGPEVAYLVDGVTKLEKVDFGAAAEAETFRKMLVATGDDVRVMVIKLADRLHNMRTIRHMKPASRLRIAKVTRDVLIPLAERLGIQVVKTELEDIVFATLHPEEYARTRALITAQEATGQEPFTAFAELLARQLAESGVAAEVTARPRHCVSVHRELLRRGRGGRPGELHPVDLARLLVVVEEPADCYAVLGELHTCWTPLPGEFKDFVAAPKFNLYQSLHTAVTVDGVVFEVLVRTPRMHRVAEFGVVALGSPQPAEPQSGEELDGTDPARPGWLRRLLEWQQETPDPDAFWSTLTADLSDDAEITAVTEEGETLVLPSGASCVDAAYLLGEEIGHRCIGARVNGRLVALSSTLADGDVLGVLTEAPALPGGPEPSGPSPRWLEFARTPGARIAIERWLAGHPAPVEPLPEPGPAAPRAPGLPAPARTGPPGRGRLVVAPGHPHAAVRLARCCTPVPPDRVTGFQIRGGSIAVHRADCPTGERMRGAGRGPVQLDWAPQVAAGPQAAAGFRVTLQAEALNRPSLLADLTAAMSAAGLDIVSAVVEPPEQLRVRHTYTVELPSAAVLPVVMRAMLRVSGVYDVRRPGLEAPRPPRLRPYARSAGNADDPGAGRVRPSEGIRDRSAALGAVDGSAESAQ